MTILVGTGADDVFRFDGETNDYYGQDGLDTIVISARFQDVDIDRFYGMNSSGSYEYYYNVNDIFVGGPIFREVDLFSLEEIRFTDLTVRLGDGDPLFDPVFYYQQNPDVYAAGIDARQHFYEYGWKEGRDPNFIFDTSGYLQAYRDVAASGMNPLEHYRNFGFAEGREVVQYGGLANYLKLNPDVAAAGVEPLGHYLEYGRYETLEDSRQTGFGAFIGSNIDYDGFDANFYLWMNPDVAASGIDPRDHYFSSGYKEGRRPNLFFDPLDYLQDNPDVAAAGLEPLTHYDQFGRYEDRSFSAPVIDQYYDTRPDVAAAGVNPLYHYLEFGFVERLLG